MPKPVREDYPDQTWDLPKLTQYVQAGLENIRQAGRHTAAQTYRIGRALFFAKQRIAAENRVWKLWLRDHDIPESTAWEAIKLFEAVKNESDLAKLTSTEAKTKYGIYHEWESKKDYAGGSSGSGEGGGNGGGRAPVPENETDEDKVNRGFRSILHGAEAIEAVSTWSPSLLYSTETSEVVRLCSEVSERVYALRQKIKPPKQPSGVKNRIAELNKL